MAVDGREPERRHTVVVRHVHVRAGAEVWLNQSVAVRAGYGIKNTINSATTLALGGSVKIATYVQLDYAFQILTGHLEDNTTQRVSFNLIF